MLKPNQLIKVRWNGQTKKYWQTKGYTFTKINDEFEVKVEDLPPKSAMFVEVECDYCGEIFSIRMYSYTSCSKCGKIACKHCVGKKAIETNIDKYGVSNVMQVSDIHNRMKETLYANYGVYHPSESKELHDKAVANSDMQASVPKRKKTCLERYGVDNVAKTDEVIQKAKNTCKIRYGGESSQCDDAVRQKSWDTLFAGGKIPTSTPERAMVETLKEMYGEENCISQYLIGKYSLDCLLTLNGTKIDVEYDGKFWHQGKQNKDEIRDKYCVNHGYKVLRFCGTDKVPSKEQIKEAVDYLVNNQQNIYKMKI